jgi:hypothetical protein
MAIGYRGLGFWLFLSTFLKNKAANTEELGIQKTYCMYIFIC